MLLELVVDIYEGKSDYPLLTHIFRGSTKREALAVLDAHKKTDEFLRGCLEKNKWKTVSCNAVVYWR